MLGWAFPPYSIKTKSHRLTYRQSGIFSFEGPSSQADERNVNPPALTTTTTTTHNQPRNSAGKEEGQKAIHEQRREETEILPV